MKKLKNLQKGFTLIELLIVIALLGALAIGLIGALDPIEQIRRGSDTGRRDAAVQLKAAGDRYYTQKGYMPWCTSATNCPSEPSGTNLSTAPASTAITNLMNSGELKSNFTTAQTANLTSIFMTGVNATATNAICFLGASKGFKTDPGSLYNANGTTLAGCPSATLSCHWCVLQ